jgi:hypothetical protein
MRNYQNDGNLSEFEFEFEGDFENDEFENDEFENDEFEQVNDEFEYDGETNYLNEFENDEFEFEENEFENDGESDTERRYERRFYELFTNNYESELEFETGFNEILHEMEQDYFWKKLKSFGSKALKGIMPIAQQVLKQIPGGAKFAPLLQSLTSDPRSFLRNAVKTFGPMALNAIAPGAGSVLGAVMNSEVTVPSGTAKQAAKDTVAMAKQAYSGFANNIAKIPPTSNPAQLKNSLQTAAQNAVQGAKAGVMSGGGNRRKHKLLSRKMQKVGGYKIITSVYKL